MISLEYVTKQLQLLTAQMKEREIKLQGTARLKELLNELLDDSNPFDVRN